MADEKDTPISKEIVSYSRSQTDLSGKNVRIIHESPAMDIAKKHNMSLRGVYILALSQDIWPCRYFRNRGSLTIRDQRKLAKSCVAVVGCGGLGGYVILMLARIGIGSLVIADPDTFDESNLNRQAFASTETLGMYKTEAASKAICSVNPAVFVRQIQTAMTYENADEILENVDVAVDALDNRPDRQMIQKISKQMKIPMVHGAVAGFEGQVLTLFPDKTGYMDLFSNNADDEENRSLDAEILLGVTSVAPVLIASLQAMATINVILKRGGLSDGRLLYSDIEQGSFSYFDF